MDEEELLIWKPEVFLFHIPLEQVNLDSCQRPANRDVAHSVWKGTILFYMGESCIHVQLNDPQGNSYGQILLEGYPGENLKPALLSSQHLALKFQNKHGEFQHARVEFSTREDSYEVNTADAPPPKKLQLGKADSVSAVTSDKDCKCMKEDTFQCGECLAKFSSAQELITHWRTIHVLKSANVGLCGLPFCCSKERRTHKKKCHPNIFSCTICGGRFLTKNELEEYCTKTHRDGVGAVLASIKHKRKKQRGVECANCGQKFVSMVLLTQHFRALHAEHLMEVGLEDESVTAESNGKSISLDKDCNFPSPRKDNLLIDFKVSHAFQCPLCDAKFASKSDLELHLLITHRSDFSGNKINALARPRFECEHCEEKFSYRTKLLKHLDKVHPVTKSALDADFKGTIQIPEDATGDPENEGAGALENADVVKRPKLRATRTGACRNLEALEEGNQIRTIKGNPDETKVKESQSEDFLKNSEKSFPCTGCRKVMNSVRGLIGNVTAMLQNRKKQLKE